MRISSVVVFRSSLFYVKKCRHFRKIRNKKVANFPFKYRGFFFPSFQNFTLHDDDIANCVTHCLEILIFVLSEKKKHVRDNFVFDGDYIIVVVAESKWKCMKPQECSICHKTFSNAGNLRQHITNVHTPGEPVQCEICSKDFKNKEYLRKHKVIKHNAPLRKQKMFPISYPNSISWNYWQLQNNYQQ